MKQVSVALDLAGERTQSLRGPGARGDARSLAGKSERQRPSYAIPRARDHDFPASQIQFHARIFLSWLRTARSRRQQRDNPFRSIIEQSVGIGMTSDIIRQIASSVSLIWIAAAIGFHIANTGLGIYMALRGIRGGGFRKIHKMLYYGTLFCLAYYLVLNNIHGNNGFWDYFVSGYFLIAVPLSKRWGVLPHAFLGIIGLTLLPLLILLQM
jgi:hypothetical protein